MEVVDGGGAGGEMFYACLNMHLKSKSIRNDSENAKGFHQRLLIHDALRKATYFRANSCYRRKKLPHRSHLPPEDMHFNDSLRRCRGNGYTQCHVHNTCDIRVERKMGGFLMELVLTPLRILLYKSSRWNEHGQMNIIPHRHTGAHV